VELMVVITIAAVVTGMTLAGYRSMATGNERTSCQTNLFQIYSALSLYSQDHDGFYPPYEPGNAAGAHGLGLWSLYAVESNTSHDQPANIGEEFYVNSNPTLIQKPIALYVKSRKQLHCPADTDNDYFFDPADASQTTINPSYLSYQVQDNGQWTYRPWRGVADGNWNAARQLIRYDTNGRYAFCARPPMPSSPGARGTAGRATSTTCSSSAARCARCRCRRPTPIIRCRRPRRPSLRR